MVERHGVMVCSGRGKPTKLCAVRGICLSDTDMHLGVVVWIITGQSIECLSGWGFLSHTTAWHPLWSTSTEPGDDGNFIQIEEVGKVCKWLLRFWLREIELEVGTRHDRSTPHDILCLRTIDDLGICISVASDEASKGTLSIHFHLNSSQNVGGVENAIHTIKVCPDRLNLGDTEMEWMHKFKDVEGHLFHGKCSSAISLNVFSNPISHWHGSCPICPTDSIISISEWGEWQDSMYPMTAPAVPRYSRSWS